MLRLTLLFSLLCLLLASCTSDETALTLTDADITDNNRGVALMGYFEYPAARNVFQTLVDRQPQWPDAKVNLAIATLNRQGEKDSAVAQDLLSEVLSDDPMNLRAHYISGLLVQDQGDMENALRHFRVVADNDPEDAYAKYYLGQILESQGLLDDAIEQYRQAITLDPYLRSSYYRAAFVLRRSGQGNEASRMLADYERLEDNPRARVAVLKYTRMGPKADALAIDLETAPVAPVPPGDVFANDPDWAAKIPALGPRSSITTADIDGDGKQDLFVSRVGPEGYNHIFDGDTKRYMLNPPPLAQVTAVNAVAWGDFNNDGQIDVYLCREGANQLWQHTGSDWVDVTTKTGTANQEWDCADTLMIDADHDGDLDLFVVNRDGPNELYSNNLDGTFRPLAADFGLTGRAGSLGAIAGDLDNDRDIDLIVIKSEPPHEVFINDRLWQYRPWSDNALTAAPLRSVTLGDSDTDGQIDLFAVHDDGGVYRWASAGRAGMQPGEALMTGAADAQIGLTDFDGDGHPDLLHTDNSGWTVYSPVLGRELASNTGELVAALPVYIDANTGPHLFVALRDGEIRRYPPGPGRHVFAAFQFSGKDEKAESMRSNRDGQGTRVELRVGTRWTIVDQLDRHSGPGQSLQPLMLGLGGASSADFVALTWSDGVFQTELDLAAGQLHAIEETQRQLSSCPVLFVWDGEKYDFVTDLLGVGGLGFFVEPGVSATPRPWEYLLLPEGLPQIKDGVLSFKLNEPMEELAYIDSVRLHVYDLPPGVSMVMDERMVIDGPPATGEAFFYNTLITPIQALDQQGRDITQTVTKADRVAAPVGELDRRFIGRLAGSNVLTLDFAEPLDRQPGTPLLIVDGWIEYPYSQTVFAAWQAGESFEAPTLEAYGRDGYWRTVYARFGYPAGMPRQMALPLRDLPPGTMRLRLSSNQEIYWDRIAVAHTVVANVQHRSTAAISATQRLTGFPRRTTKPQRIPDYDYSDRDSFWDTRYPSGLYSAFGSVIDLVQRTDDAVAIIGPGEEIEFDFVVRDHPDAAATDTANPFTRRYVLEVRGWAKDMDLYTRDGETVGPLPMRSGDQPRDELRDALHRRYHTRYESGR